MTSRNDFDSMPQLRRRDFCLAGTAALLLPGIASAAARKPSPLAIGYCEGPLEVADTARSLVAAERLFSGDPELAGKDVRVTVLGLLGPGKRLADLGIRSMELRFCFSAVPGDSLPRSFRAWSYGLLPVEHSAPAVAFRAPIASGLSLELELETFGLERFGAELVTGSEAHVPKLRTGHYLIAPGAEAFPRRRLDAQPREPLIAFSVEAAAHFETEGSPGPRPI